MQSTPNLQRWRQSQRVSREEEEEAPAAAGAGAGVGKRLVGLGVARRGSRPGGGDGVLLTRAGVGACAGPPAPLAKGMVAPGRGPKCARVVVVWRCIMVWRWCAAAAVAIKCCACWP
mmetsp:Transcript_73511/g.129755  ORF Transcript_73511/g.129755 Transcript_73511/m.129755 type:complete len:117 (+) Transcript_73511:597-947(+)